MVDTRDPKYRDLWRDATEHYHAVIDPLQRRLESFVEYAVEYGRAVLRTALELNGGGVIALPSLGSLFGSIWSRGTLLPELGVLSFLLGLLAAAIGYACGFFHFMSLQVAMAEHIERRGTFLNAQFNAAARGEPAPKEDNTPTKAEQLNRNRASRLQLAAIAAASLSLFAFMCGASITAYVLSGHVVGADGK